jgi:Flp pilus assembly protein TadB
MAIGRGHTPREEELRRRAAQLADREARLARRERDVAAREAELRCDDVDGHLRRILLDGRANERRRATLRLVASALVAVGLIAFLLAWGGLGHATTAAEWALAATGAAVWALALSAPRR